VLDKLRSRGEEQVVKLDIMRQGRRMEVQGKVPVADAPPLPPTAPAPPAPPPRDKRRADGT
jgi:hypothetical protein